MQVVGSPADSCAVNDIELDQDVLEFYTWLICRVIDEAGSRTLDT